MQHDPSEIIVIGGGIIGVSTALELSRNGFQVTLLDRKGIAAEASKGNAGAYAFTDIVPLATPGIMKKAPKWLLDPLGPLFIPPSYALKITPWMLRFWRASWKDRYQGAMEAQASLNNHSRAALERQIDAVRGEAMFQREGQMQLYEGQKEFEASLPSWEIRKQHDIRFDLLTSNEAIAEIQPGIDPRFTHAGFTPDWINVCCPERWTHYLAEQYLTNGGKLITEEVRNLKQSGEIVEITTDQTTYRAKKVIVASGAWSHQLAAMVGDRIPLETERGYNTTLPEGAFDLRTHLTFTNHGFVVSRINAGVRVGGAAELGGLKLPPNYKRSEILLNKAKKFLPSLNTDNGKQWMGFRPSMPDSLPVIGTSSKANNIIYAFGHGHLGLTQAAGTAELVASLVCNKPAPLSLAPFNPDRF
ncbi:NAD(P)/FAD-dependent oxidoreductase [Cohaesibacter gelatinilyticus]|uniref:D-amino-acid dehydrogenase n=1 Tax=Cohaesibacter gelatinilyticus TaxID=372072 RepID=A0A285PFH9_9HYPH|nr:FAD-binding oxidoreductase [Cohaesibacter gelatinilyticus]SNZ20459.1 D-amino-acid dehydrogenase [Cohaesibacter gelatinilyticus]